ncbi:MAG: hypothetical protein RMM58_02685 [Chloroflexota bacterium]|nr:hypothetical protein [Dehalococcoidia bacterium]MDW8252763.1 hypothetical protein [Chloroflexota bacterium]
MMCPSCGAELLEEAEACLSCRASSSPTLPAVVSSPALPARVERSAWPTLLRPLLPIAGGVAAVAVTASLAVAGLRRWPGFLLSRGRTPRDDVPLIEIDEAIVIRARSTRVRAR